MKKMIEASNLLKRKKWKQPRSALFLIIESSCLSPQTWNPLRKLESSLPVPKQYKALRWVTWVWTGCVHFIEGLMLPSNYNIINQALMRSLSGTLFISSIPFPAGLLIKVFTKANSWAHFFLVFFIIYFWIKLIK
jgi:hypothetical protein